MIGCFHRGGRGGIGVKMERVVASRPDWPPGDHGAAGPGLGSPEPRHWSLGGSHPGRCYARPRDPRAHLLGLVCHLRTQRHNRSQGGQGAHGRPGSRPGGGQETGAVSPVGGRARSGCVGDWGTPRGRAGRVRALLRPGPAGGGAVGGDCDHVAQNPALPRFWQRRNAPERFLS